MQCGVPCTCTAICKKHFLILCLSCFLPPQLLILGKLLDTFVTLLMKNQGAGRIRCADRASSVRSLGKAGGKELELLWPRFGGTTSSAGRATGSRKASGIAADGRAGLLRCLKFKRHSRPLMRQACAPTLKFPPVGALVGLSQCGSVLLLFPFQGPELLSAVVLSEDPNIFQCRRPPELWF